MRTVATGLGFPEGPVALPNGDVLVVEIRRGTLTRVAPPVSTLLLPTPPRPRDGDGTAAAAAPLCRATGERCLERRTPGNHEHRPPGE